MGELQGPLPELLLKKPLEGPKILSRVLDIIMDSTKQGILSLSSMGGLDTMNDLTILSTIHMSKT